MKKLLGGLFIVMLIIACGSDPANYTYELTKDETYTWAGIGITSLDASTVNGDVTVNARQDAAIALTVTKECLGEDSTDAEEAMANIQINTDVNGSELIVDVDMPGDDERDYEAHLAFLTPSSLYLDLLTINGSITIRNMLGGARMRSTNGTLTLENFEGNVDGETINGGINCDMNALTTGESLLFRTENGNTNISLPLLVATSFDLENDNGDIDINGFANVVYTVNEVHHKVGTINGGGAQIDVQVTNGNITLEAQQ